nr:MAG TPA: hypothetical protein [Bacteriophage sp.]
MTRRPSGSVHVPKLVEVKGSWFPDLLCSVLHLYSARVANSNPFSCEPLYVAIKIRLYLHLLF